MTPKEGTREARPLSQGAGPGLTVVCGEEWPLGGKERGNRKDRGALGGLKSGWPGVKSGARGRGQQRSASLRAAEGQQGRRISVPSGH